MAIDMCSDCGEEKEVNDDFLCSDCEGNADTCDCCGCWFRIEDLTEEFGHKICNSCMN